MDAGPEAVADEAERARAKEQAARVHRKAIAAAIVVTIATVGVGALVR
jgi:hypothetical protein